jgi:uncharacterized RDD family membrane protein YckC
MTVNPYAPPTTDAVIEETYDGGNDVLAGRFTRFAAALVDGILVGLVIWPIMFITGYFQRSQEDQVGALEELGMQLFGITVMLALNGYLLSSRGQSVGKLLTKIQIVDAADGKLLPFLRVYVYRQLWVLPLSILVTLTPGYFDDLIISVVLLVDAAMIFGNQRRCLHDYIAGSKVVLYRENRARLSA